MVVSGAVDNPGARTGQKNGADTVSRALEVHERARLGESRVVPEEITRGTAGVAT